MKYRLKADPTATCEADVSSEKELVSIVFTNKNLHEFAADVSQERFREDWELIPEKEPPIGIDERLREMATRPDGTIIYLPEVSRLCRGAENRIGRMKAEIVRLNAKINQLSWDLDAANAGRDIAENKVKEFGKVPFAELVGEGLSAPAKAADDSQECRPSEADMMAGASPEPAETQGSKYDALWNRYIEMTKCNAQLGEALVDSLVAEKERADQLGLRNEVK